MAGDRSKGVLIMAGVPSILCMACGRSCGYTGRLWASWGKLARAGVAVVLCPVSVALWASAAILGGHCLRGDPSGRSCPTGGRSVDIVRRIASASVEGVRRSALPVDIDAGPASAVAMRSARAICGHGTRGGRLRGGKAVPGGRSFDGLRGADRKGSGRRIALRGGASLVLGQAGRASGGAVPMG